jgi:hypothetical protein
MDKSHRAITTALENNYLIRRCLAQTLISLFSMQLCAMDIEKEATGFCKNAMSLK